MQHNPPGLELAEENKIANTKKLITGVTWWQFLSQVLKVHKGFGRYIIPLVVLDWSDRNLTSLIVARCFSVGFSTRSFKLACLFFDGHTLVQFKDPV